MTLDGNLGIRVNGEHRRVPGGISMCGDAERLGLSISYGWPSSATSESLRVSLGEVTVEDGDDYEIVHFVGGG